MTSGQFWRMTPREFQAFARVKELHDERDAMRWAVTSAMFANVNFRCPIDCRQAHVHRHEPFTADEFLGRSSPREQPARGLTPAQQAVFERERMRLNLALTGALDDAQVPEWAKATVAASKARNQVH